MKYAEVISIGDELTSGQRLDTNSRWLSERLGEQGIRVLYHTTVADDVEANVRVFRAAVERADVVVATGGLGPTADDLTRQVLADMTGNELVLDDDIVVHIRALFARFNREMPEKNVVQAMFPRGSRVIPNPNGTAPGIDIDVPRETGEGSSRVFALPGVPAEMFPMWEDWVGPKLMESGDGRQVIRHHLVKCFGAGESHIEEMLPDLIRRGRVPTVGITASKATITLRITAAGSTPEACHEQMVPTIDTIHETLGEIVFGGGDEELEHAVVRELKKKDGTLSIVDAGTGGLIAELLDDVPEADDRLVGAIVAKNGSAIRSLLGIDAPAEDDGDWLNGGAVRAMAEACRDRLSSDYALAVVDLPAAQQLGEKPRSFFALAGPDETIVRSGPHIGGASLRRIRCAKQAMNLVRLAMLRTG